MFNISSFQVNHLETGCITDTPPVFSFSLISDCPGEALSHAVIRCGTWEKQINVQAGIVYEGPLEPFTTYRVHLSVVGVLGNRAEKETTFRTGRCGMLWKASWISDVTYEWPRKQSPVPMLFRKRFSVEGPILRAWMTVTALGIYECCLNGNKIGNDFFAPGFTSYRYQIQYQTYDLTDFLPGQNEIVVTVAGGWAVGSFTFSRKSRIAADHPSLLCEIFIDYADGRHKCVMSDTTWNVCEEGPVREASWYDGETFDAHHFPNEASWKKAQIVHPRGEPKLVAQYAPSVRIMETLHPQSCTQAPSGEWIYDFGQNFAGVIAFDLPKGREGQEIIIRHAEVLDRGELFVKSLRTAKATLRYRCKDGEQSYAPRFTYMGFRYVGISGVDPNDIHLSAFVLHSELERVGTFSCSNPLINRLQENIQWGARSNFVEIPTDCPQRDERLGWTGDISVFASTACFNFDMSRFLDKWLRDLAYEQNRLGGLPMVVPMNGDAFPKMATSCWGDACILVPWAEYLARGDQNLLCRCYPTMKRFLKAAKRWSGFCSFGKHRYIWRLPFHFGDWCAPGEGFRQWKQKGRWVATAYFSNSCLIVAHIAGLLGENSDEKYYLQLREKILSAYRSVFTDGQGTLTKPFQTAYVLPLYFKMTEGKETTVMADHLANLVTQAGNHLTTGFTGTPYLLFALSDQGHLDEAYRVLLQEECPSWLYEVKAGATTIWERWDALKPDGTVNPDGMVSFNHYALGAVGDWLYRRLLGLEPTSGGYKTFSVQPMPGGNITWAKGTHRTPYGIISVSWKIEASKLMVDVEVPVSTTCHLILPNKTEHILSSGTHSFQQPWDKMTS